MNDVETLRSTMGQMQDHQNSLVTQMESLTTDTAKLAKNFKKLQGAVDMMKNLEVSTSHFLKIEIVIQQVAIFLSCLVLLEQQRWIIQHTRGQGGYVPPHGPYCLAPQWAQAHHRRHPPMNIMGRLRPRARSNRLFFWIVVIVGRQSQR